MLSIFGWRPKLSARAISPGADDPKRKRFDLVADDSIGQDRYFPLATLNWWEFAIALYSCQAANLNRI